MMSEADVQVLKTFNEVNPYLEAIRSLSDSDSDALGFLPPSAFFEQACHNRLWVVVSKKSRELLGYLLFGGKYPDLKIFQIFVRTEHRHQQIGGTLIQHIVAFAENHNFLSISARVAADLPANRFWQSLGFTHSRQVPGGKSKHRTINIWIRELDTPSLLKLMRYEPSRQSLDARHLVFLENPISQIPGYVIDLNIYFDLVRRREHNAQAARLIEAGLSHRIRIYVTPEFHQELGRNVIPGRTDPILEMAKTFPTLPQISPPQLDKLLPILQGLIFPAASPQGKRTRQIRSDLRHLAYCIYHQIRGFITRDAPVLAASEKLLEKFQLEILSPADILSPFGIQEFSPLRSQASVGQRTLEICTAANINIQETETFLTAQGINRQHIPEIWNSGTTNSPRRRLAVRCDGNLIGLASWNSADPLNPIVDLYLYVDEEDDAAENIIEHMLEAVLSDASLFIHRFIRLHTTPEQVQTRRTAANRGFVISTGQVPLDDMILAKFALRGPVVKDTWSRLVRAFQQLTGLKLPRTMPTWEELQYTGITMTDTKTQRRYLCSLFDFETLISPGLVLCRGRDGLILPIQARYARELFPKLDAQIGLLPAAQAILHVEKAYFRYPTRASLFSKGLPIVFYLSGSGGGSKEAFGCARITYSAVLPIEAVEFRLQCQGVLSTTELHDFSGSQGKIHVFTFDNFTPLPQPISFKQLEKEALISKARLVTVERLSGENFSKLCSLAFQMDRPA